MIHQRVSSLNLHPLRQDLIGAGWLAIVADPSKFQESCLCLSAEITCMGALQLGASYLTF